MIALLLLLLTAAAPAQTLWRDPGDVSKTDFADA